jgi:hypothetical protein
VIIGFAKGRKADDDSRKKGKTNECATFGRGALNVRSNGNFRSMVAYGAVIFFCIPRPIALSPFFPNKSAHQTIVRSKWVIFLQRDGEEITFI